MSQESSHSDRMAELEADNRRLRRLLDQQGAPSELRHRLHNTVAMLRIIIRRSAETTRDLEHYVGHIEDRLDALARAQAAADEHGSISLHTLITEELLQYGASEGNRLILNGPDVELRPRSGQVLALAIHELAVNSVEHGVLGAAGDIVVEVGVASGSPHQVLSITWQERGGLIAETPTHEGFGTEVLTRTLAYELRSEVALTYNSTGLSCILQMPLTDWIGKIAEG